MKTAKVLVLLLIGLAACADSTALNYFKSAAEHYKNSEIEKTRSELLKSLEYDNSNQEAAKLLVEIEEEKFAAREGEYTETAREFYEKGIAAYRKGDAAGAETEWRKALKVAPSNPQIKKFLLRVEPDNDALKEPVLSKKERAKQKPVFDQAKQERKEARKESRVSPEKKKADDLYYEGLRLYKQGKIDDAVSCWEQALKIDPENQKAQKSLEKTGKKGDKL